MSLNDFKERLESISGDCGPFHHPSDVFIVALNEFLQLKGFYLVSFHENGPLLDKPIRSLADFPEKWNEGSQGSFSLRFKHQESNEVLLIKSIPMGSSVLLIHMMRLDAKETLSSIELNVPQYLAPKVEFPTVSKDLTPSKILKMELDTLNQLFSKFSGLTFFNNTKDPKFSKSGNETKEQSESTMAQPPRRSKLDSETSNAPYIPPSFHPQIQGAPHPYSIGQRDLDPLGGAAPMMPPPFGGRHPLHPLGDPYGGGFGGFGGDGGGNVMGPNHPMFGDRPSIGRPWGGDSYLPRGAVPPGARFDPIGPSGVPDRNANRVRPNMSGPPGSNIFSGEPDNDELPPPGSMNMFL